MTRRKDGTALVKHCDAWATIRVYGNRLRQLKPAMVSGSADDGRLPLNGSDLSER